MGVRGEHVCVVLYLAKRDFLFLSFVAGLGTSGGDVVLGALGRYRGVEAKVLWDLLFLILPK